MGPCSIPPLPGHASGQYPPGQSILCMGTPAELTCAPPLLCNCVESSSRPFFDSGVGLLTRAEPLIFLPRNVVGKFKWSILVKVGFGSYSRTIPKSCSQLLLWTCSKKKQAPRTLRAFTSGESFRFSTSTLACRPRHWKLGVTLPHFVPI